MHSFGLDQSPIFDSIKTLDSRKSALNSNEALDDTPGEYAATVAMLAAAEIPVLIASSNDKSQFGDDR